MELANSTYWKLQKKFKIEMSKILGSIQNLEEAKILIESKIDIIDLKDPANGALGKLE